VTIEAGKATTKDLEIPFDANTYRRALAAQRGVDAGLAAPTGSAKGPVAPPASAKTTGPAASAKR
jgi:hypothetical protein